MRLAPCSSFAGTQDAFGANYVNGQTRWQYRRNQYRLVDRMLEKYASSESRHSGPVHIVPVPPDRQEMDFTPAVTIEREFKMPATGPNPVGREESVSCEPSSRDSRSLLGSGLQTVFEPSNLKWRLKHGSLARGLK